MDDFAKMLGEILGEDTPPRRLGDIPSPAVPVTPEALTALANSYNERHTFKPGDIVKWKDGLKNARAAGPFVVIEVLENPVFNPDSKAGSPYYREPQDIRIGFVDCDDDFLIYHIDSHRIQPVTQ